MMATTRLNISKEERSVKALEDLLDAIQDDRELPELRKSLRETARADVDSVTVMVKALPLVERISLLRRLLLASAAIKQELGEGEWACQGGESVIVSNQQAQIRHGSQICTPPSEDTPITRPVRGNGAQKEARGLEGVGDSGEETAEENSASRGTARAARRTGGIQPKKESKEPVSKRGPGRPPGTGKVGRPPKRKREAYVESPVLKDERMVSPPASPDRPAKAQSQVSKPCDNCKQRGIECVRPQDDKACRLCHGKHVACKIDGKHSTTWGLRISSGKRVGTGS